MPPAIGIKLRRIHHPGFPTASKVFHIQINENTASVIIKRMFRNGIQNPIKRSIGHQCISAILLEISSGPIIGIQARPAGSVFVFLAIAMNASEV